LVRGRNKSEVIFSCALLSPVNLDQSICWDLQTGYYLVGHSKKDWQMVTPGALLKTKEPYWDLNWEKMTDFLMEID
jgi:hypothetical protein